MKLITLSLMLLFSVSSFAEQLEKYTASNGKIYVIGDSLKLSNGSGRSGQFIYFEVGGWVGAASQANGGDNTLAKNFSGATVTIKKIRKTTVGKVLFVVSVNNITNITNYNLDIEGAISSCEILDCNRNTNVVTVINQPSKYDELKKLKELFDSNVLTEEEYNKEKDKLLK